MDNQQSTAVELKLVENVMTLIFMLQRGSIAFGIWTQSDVLERSIKMVNNI